MVYTAKGRLFLRPMSDSQDQGDPRNRRSDQPGVFPDGQSLAFWADSALKRIGIGGGTAVTIFAGAVGHQASITWSDRPQSCLRRRGRSCGSRRSSQENPEVLLDLSNSEDQAFRPHLLPDGRTLLFTIVKRTSPTLPAIDAWDAAQIVVQSLETNLRKPTHRKWGRRAVCPHRPYRVHIGGNAVSRCRSTVETLELTGGAVPVVEGDPRCAVSDRSARPAFAGFRHGFAHLCARSGVGRGSRTWCDSIAGRRGVARASVGALHPPARVARW